MHWLSPDVANTLQLVTLPLEVIGLTLATIEVRFPTLTQWLNLRLVAAHEAVERSDERWRGTYPRIAAMVVAKRFHVPVPGWFHWTMVTLIAVAMLGAVAITVLRFLPELSDIREAMRGLLESFMWWFYMPVAIGAAMVALAIRFIVRFAKDRAVGTLGIVVASLGVAGEAYQFAVALGG